MESEIEKLKYKGPLLTTCEYAFFKSLGKLINSFKAEMDGATFNIAGREFDIPRCTPVDDLVQMAIKARQKQLGSKPKFKIGDQVMLNCYFQDGSPVDGITGRVGTITGISELIPAPGASRFSYTVSDDSGPIINCNEKYLKLIKDHHD